MDWGRTTSYTHAATASISADEPSHETSKVPELRSASTRHLGSISLSNSPRRALFARQPRGDVQCPRPTVLVPDATQFPRLGEHPRRSGCQAGRGLTGGVAASGRNNFGRYGLRIARPSLYQTRAGHSTGCEHDRRSGEANAARIAEDCDHRKVVLPSALASRGD